MEMRQTKSFLRMKSGATNCMLHIRDIYFLSQETVVSLPFLYFFFSALRLAARFGHRLATCMLLHDARLDERLNAALVAACTAGHADVVQLLLETAPPDDVNGKDETEMSPLLSAAKFKHAECIRLLIEHPTTEVSNNAIPLKVIYMACILNFATVHLSPKESFLEKKPMQ